VTLSQRICAVFWIAGGLNHFRVPKVYESIMPDYVPAHREMVLLSGVAEIIGGVALIPPSGRRFARWWLLGVLAAVYPANVHMALNPERYEQVPPVALWARLPLQFLCGWWVWKATEPA
jgi:uncharacterized membrane protein